MKKDFKRILAEELAAIRNFLPGEQAESIINDQFSYNEQSSFGELSLKNLEYLVQQCFYKDWTPQLGKIYKIFTRKEGEEEQK